MTVIDDFRTMFNIEDEQQLDEWNGLKGLMDESGTLFCAPIPGHEWLADNLPSMSLERLQSQKVQGNWVTWSIAGIKRIKTRFQPVDLNQMVIRKNF